MNKYLALFSNFNIPYKLLIISLSFLVPIGIMLYLIVQSVTGYIQFATYEQYGNIYQRPLEELLHFIPQHERLVLLYSGKDEERTEILNVESKIDKAMANLEIVNKKLGIQLKFTDEGLKERNRSYSRVENLKVEWEDLKKNYATLTTEVSEEKHKHFVGDIRTMITHCGDTSNLILDPDLDSYYLMDSTLLILPQTQNRIADILREGGKAFKDKLLTHEEQRQFSIYAVQLKEDDLDHIVSDATTYLNEDKNFYGVSPSLQKNIPPSLRVYQQTTQRFIDLIDHLADAETIDVPLEDFTSAGLAAREESFRLWNISVDELDVLLVKRIAFYEHSRFISLVWAILSLVLSCFLVLFIAQSILTPLKELMIGIDKVTKGNFTWQVTVKKYARDEIAQVSQAFNTMIGNLKNVTASRDELDKAHEELKSIQSQLVQSEKMASVGQLAAGVAHEINNPVGFISNNMELLGQYVGEYTQILRMLETLKKSIEEEDIEKSKAIVKEISQFEEKIQLDQVMSGMDNLLQQNQKGVERIQKIVADLKTFAREGGDVLELVKIEEIIDSILSIVQSELKYKAELKKNYEDTPLVKCDSQKLGQVFINLFVNAAQAIEEKGTITVRTYLQDQFVCVDVSDTGKGIPPENLKKIFDAFFTTKPVGQGTGLGLSVSYEIVKKHGGELKVRSKVGEGTTFTVMLPRGSDNEA